MRRGDKEEKEANQVSMMADMGRTSQNAMFNNI